MAAGGQGMASHLPCAFLQLFPAPTASRDGSHAETTPGSERQQLLFGNLISR